MLLIFEVFKDDSKKKPWNKINKGPHHYFGLDNARTLRVDNISDGLAWARERRRDGRELFQVDSGRRLQRRDLVLRGDHRRRGGRTLANLLQMNGRVDVLCERHGRRQAQRGAARRRRIRRRWRSSHAVCRKRWWCAHQCLQLASFNSEATEAWLII